MRVAVLSMFQNSMRYIERYVRQFRNLVRDAPMHSFEPVLGEGDSTDNESTWNRLNQEYPGCVNKCTHGGLVFGSADTPQRWRQLSTAWNKLLPHVRPDHEGALYVEADLIWEPRTMIRLLDRLNEVEAVSLLCTWDNHKERQPLCGCKTPDLLHLYDWFGFRSQGKTFTVCHPYNPVFERSTPNGLYPIDAAGSIIAMRGQVARTCRFIGPEHGLLGFNHDIRNHGYKVWIDPKLRVTHP